MKKLLSMMLVLVLLTGCSTENNKKDDLKEDVQEENGGSESVSQTIIGFKSLESIEDWGIFYEDYIVELIDEMQNDERVLVYNKIGVETLYTNDCEVVRPQEDEKLFFVENQMHVLYNNTANMIEINNGGYDVVEGRFYNELEVENGDKVMLVTSEFASLNSISIGDMIEFSYTQDNSELVKYIDDEKDLVIEYEVIGIYENNAQEVYWSVNQPVVDQNLLLVPSSSILDYISINKNALLDKSNDQSGNTDNFIGTQLQMYNSMTPIIQLKDSNDLDGFIADYQDKLDGYYTIEVIEELSNDN